MYEFNSIVLVPLDFESDFLLIIINYTKLLESGVSLGLKVIQGIKVN